MRIKVDCSLEADVLRAFGNAHLLADGRRRLLLNDVGLRCGGSLIDQRPEGRCPAFPFGLFLGELLHLGFDIVEARLRLHRPAGGRAGARQVLVLVDQLGPSGVRRLALVGALALVEELRTPLEAALDVFDRRSGALPGGRRVLQEVGAPSGLARDFPRGFELVLETYRRHSSAKAARCRCYLVREIFAPATPRRYALPTAVEDGVLVVES